MRVKKKTGERNRERDTHRQKEGEIDRYVDREREGFAHKKKKIEGEEEL